MKLDEQSDEELNRMLAELLGWTDFSFSPLIGFHQQKSDEKSKECGGRWRFSIPSYVTSLNAVAVVEAGLTDERYEVYRWTLWGLCKQSEVTAWHRAYLSSSARQRTIALIQTLQTK